MGMDNKTKKNLKVDEGAINEKMRELASLLNYEYHDIKWLTEAMLCRIIKHGGGGKNRDNYTNGKYSVLGDTVLKTIVADTRFDFNTSMMELFMNKNQPQNYEKLFSIDWNMCIYNFAYDEDGFYGPYLHAPLPAHDLYIEAIIGAIFKDRGYEYVKEWTLEFFNRNGYKIGIDQIYTVK